jgi:hypothetical protein
MNYIYNNQTKPTRDFNRYERFFPTPAHNFGNGLAEIDGDMLDFASQRSFGRNSSLFKKTIYKKHSDSTQNNLSQTQVNNSNASISKSNVTTSPSQQPSTAYGNFNRYSSQNYYYYYSAPSNLLTELNRLKNSTTKNPNCTAENKNNSVYSTTQVSTKADKFTRFKEPQVVKTLGRCKDNFFILNNTQNKSSYSTQRYDKNLTNDQLRNQFENKNNLNSKNSESESFNEESSLSSFTDINMQTHRPKNGTFFHSLSSNSKKMESILKPKTTLLMNKAPVQNEAAKLITNNNKKINRIDSLRFLDKYKPSLENKTQIGSHNEIYPYKTIAGSLRPINKPFYQQSIYMHQSSQYKKSRDSKGSKSSTTKLLSSFSSTASSRSSGSNDSSTYKSNNSSASSLTSSDKLSTSRTSSISNQSFNSIELEKNTTSNTLHKTNLINFLQPAQSKAEPFKNLYKNSTKTYETKADFTPKFQRSDFLRSSLRHKKDLKSTLPNATENECKQKQQLILKKSDNLFCLNEPFSGKENENITPNKPTNKQPIRIVYDVATSTGF